MRALEAQEFFTTQYWFFTRRSVLMNTNTVRMFEGWVAAAVSTTNSKDTHLVVNEEGVLSDVPNDVKGFHLFIGLPKGTRGFVAQKNVGMELGGYSTEGMADIGTGAGLQWTALATPVAVKRAGQNVWTVWHTDTPNRVDVWLVGPKGCMALYQIGVITHDNGATWRLHGEVRWQGKLFRKDSGELVARPDEPRVKWGPFVTWKTVFDHPEFKKLVALAEIDPWSGKPQDLEPPLPTIPSGNYAVVQWFVPFAGQTGQGYVWMLNGGRNQACIHGVDLIVPPDSDGVKRLHRGDVVKYLRTGRFGNKESLKLEEVSLHSRTW